MLSYISQYLGSVKLHYHEIKILTLSCAVTIKLTPLGHDEKENHRMIKLSNEKKEAEIGRASKNAHKGLMAGPTNAWFDYPILSRTHAMFTFCPQHQVSTAPPKSPGHS